MDTTAYSRTSKVSIIVPMYNAASFLKETLDSILNQTFTDFELLLIDDCSKDNTLEIANSFSDPRIYIVKNEKNLGAGGTRNKGIKLAQSTYIAFCDADDIMFPNRLEEQYNFMEQHPDIDGMIQAIKDQDLKKIAGKLGNVLETVTVKEYPVIQEIKDKMLEFGAIGSLMSGSGPTVFGLFTNPKAAQEAYEELRYGESAELAKQVYLTNFYNQKEEKNHGKQA